jgi:hypothetical protein
MSSNGTNSDAPAANGSVGTIDFESGDINGIANGHPNSDSNDYTNTSQSNGQSNGHINGDAPHVENANGNINGHSSDPEAGKYTRIPGPLGIESASLKGKVALVTGAGMSPCHQISHTLMADNDD